MEIFAILLIFVSAQSEVTKSVKKGWPTEIIGVERNKAVKALSDTSWLKRAEMFYKIKAHSEIPEVRELLINQLIFENRYLDSIGKENVTEGMGEYHIDIIAEVVKLVTPADTFVLPHLIHPLETVGGRVIYSGIASFGEVAIPYLLKDINSREDISSQTACVEIVGRILDSHKVEQETKESVKQTLIKMLKSYPLVSLEAIKVLRQMNDPSVKLQIQEALINMLSHEAAAYRIEAIKILADIGDTSVIPKLKEVAEKDTWKETIDASERGGKKGDKMTIYPVREAAEQALKEIKAKQTIKSDTIQPDTKKN